MKRVVCIINDKALTGWQKRQEKYIAGTKKNNCPEDLVC